MIADAEPTFEKSREKLLDDFEMAANDAPAMETVLWFEGHGILEQEITASQTEALNG